jgi:pimeloyl-ACP methyl ester carboxylesterase
MRSEDVSWALGDTIVEATIAAPNDPGTYPGVVLVAGSGPTDRNWESPLLPGTNGSGRLLAETLAASGYVTLRYDKRASGPHAVQNMTMLAGSVSLESHFDELHSAVLRLQSHPDVDSAHIFALTSSEGAIHALYYQSHAGITPFTGLILTGAPGRAISEVAGTQVLSQLALMPESDDLIARYDALIRHFEEGLPFAPDAKLPEFVNNLVGGLSAPINQPFSRQLWSFRAADHLRNVSAPVLIVIGKKDIQVDWRLDGGALEAAAQGKSRISFFYPENANHVLKHQRTPQSELSPAIAMSNYNAPEANLDAETLETIQNWLQKHSG